MGKPLIIWKKNGVTVGFANPMFSIRCATVVELRLQQMGDFYEKKRILQWKIFNFGRL